MTDGIRRTNPGINPAIDTNTNQVENDGKAKVNSTKQPVPGYSTVRDSYEATKSAINQNTKPPSSDAQPKNDASTANLLNQQLTTARLGSPLFSTKATQTGGNKDMASLLSRELKTVGVEMSSPEKLRQISDAINKGTNAADGNTPLPQQDPGRISDRSQVLPKYFLNETIAEAKNKINEAERQIHQLKEEIKELVDQIKALDEKIAEAEAAYQESPTPELKEKIAQLKERKETLEDEIKQKTEQIKTLETEVKTLHGQTGQPVDKPAQDVSNMGK